MQIYVFYELGKYYQNHKRYVRSRSDQQLGGRGGTASSCEPERFVNGTANPSLPANGNIDPCGLAAWSFFNDTYSFSIGGASLPVDVGSYLGFCLIVSSPMQRYSWGSHQWPFYFQLCVQQAWHDSHRSIFAQDSHLVSVWQLAILLHVTVLQLIALGQSLHFNVSWAMKCMCRRPILHGHMTGIISMAGRLQSISTTSQISEVAIQLQCQSIAMSTLWCGSDLVLSPPYASFGAASIRG